MLAEDAAGFATTVSLSLIPPEGSTYFQTPVNYVSDGRVHVALLFDRYYTDEHLAPAAERAYWQHSRRETREVCITVRVREGLAVLEEVYVAGKPVREFVQQEDGPRSWASSTQSPGAR